MLDLNKEILKRKLENLEKEKNLEERRNEIELEKAEIYLNLVPLFAFILLLLALMFVNIKYSAYLLFFYFCYFIIDESYTAIKNSLVTVVEVLATPVDDNK